MSQKVQDLYSEGEFEELLDEAEANAANDWETQFVDDLQAKFDQYGRRMYLSPAQQEALERIANDE